MSVYRRFVRAKKGMSTIFGALFFIILVLMGFNLMVWNFIQFDSYNHVITSMGIRDQQASSENLVVVQPGAINVTANSFNILVTNLGGSGIIINRIYINNINGLTQQCSASAPIQPCTLDAIPNTASCLSGISCYFKNGNIQIGELNHMVSVQGISVGDGSGYQIILATSRGRQFSFFFPWPVTPPSGGGGGTGAFQTNIGPLTIYFDYKSFNFTQGSQTSSQSAFCVPSSTPMVLWIKVANNAPGAVTLLPNTIIQLQGYGVNGFGQFITNWIVDSSTVNPNNIVGYTMTNPYVLPGAPVNGAASSVIIKFGGVSQGGTGGLTFSRNNNWITFIGFFYIYGGQPQGETVPFMDMESVSGWPGSC